MAMLSWSSTPVRSSGSSYCSEVDNDSLKKEFRDLAGLSRSFAESCSSFISLSSLPSSDSTCSAESVFNFLI